jgi:alcohol dehydrogenase class IV
VLERTQNILELAKIEVVLFDQVEPNPTIETIMEGAQLAREEHVRWVVGLGGGSAMDAAKAIALMAVSQEDIRDFLKGMRPTQTPLPVVAIPTTAGSGSEVTPYAVITDVSAGDKYCLSSPLLFPKMAFLDAELTASMPEAISVDTGLVALCHAIESLFSDRRSLFSDLYARCALDRIINGLPLVGRSPENLQARAEMQMAATFAGMAIADTATLLPHALSCPVTVGYDIPHGRVIALLMPAFLERLVDQEPERVAFVGRILGEGNDISKALRDFIESLGVAPRLGAYGVREEDIDMFSKQAVDREQLHRTPGEWLQETLKEIYRRSM